jgi:hypothetical protein
MPLLEYFDIEYIEKLDLQDVFIILNSINNKQLLKISTEWFSHEELDIDREIKSKEGMEAKSVEFQRVQLRKKRYKGYVMD